jgi:L-lactate dehydrogenase (cytochrome)
LGCGSILSARCIDPTSTNVAGVMRVINSIGDLRDLARKRIPRAIFDYADRGAYDEITMERNRADLTALTFRQRVMVDVSQVTVATEVLGERWALPVGIAPTGLAGLFHRDGEIHGARAALDYGVPFCLSTMSICSIEDVSAAVTRPFWFQIYLMKDRGFNAELIERARSAKCSALVLTVDMPVQSERRRDAKNGLSIPPRLTLRNVLDVATKPGWAFSVPTGRRRTFGNLQSRMRDGGGMTTLAQWIGSQFEPSVTWDDITWIRERWPGKFILKGIMDPEDAHLACVAGVDALVVSNHGGRQLDGAPSSISVLAEVCAAVNGRCEILFDGGIQSGQDVLKAVALGASACLIGKAFLYGLAAQGGVGVTAALSVIAKELKVSLALTGQTDIRGVRSGVLRPAPPRAPIASGLNSGAITTTL